MTTEIMGISLNITCILYVCFAVAIDTFFGLLRAIRFRCWNSSFGIDGAIRKISMIACIAFLTVLDAVCHFNLISLFQSDIVSALGQIGIHAVGFAGFFGILLIAYESVSILKNMYLCGLPVKWVWDKVYRFLNKYTDELPDTDEIGGCE